MLNGPNPLVVLYMPCEDTQNDLFHDLPWHQGQVFISQNPPFNPYWRLVSQFLMSTQLRPPWLNRTPGKYWKMAQWHLHQLPHFLRVGGSYPVPQISSIMGVSC